MTSRMSGALASLRIWLKPLLALLALALAAFLLHRALSGQDPAELTRRLAAADRKRILAALGFALASYACLSGFDYLGLIYAGRPLAWPRVALASFTSLSLGHNLGFAALSSGAVRYRFYARWGLSAGEVAKVILFCAMTVAIGLAALAAIALLLQPRLAMTLTGMTAGGLHWLAGALVASLAGYLCACALLRRTITIRGHSFRLPSFRLALGQFIVGPINFALVAACLQQALAIASEASYADVASAYVLANVATLITHVPGGLGVIETVVGALLGSTSEMLVGLVLFRLAYFLLPLVCGAILFALSELLIERHSRKESARGGETGSTG
ncbi:lysylphosphatidylglycerol synthase domain-containing protein [Bosea thiooxidans]